MMVGAERARWGERVSMQSSEIITRDLRGQSVRTKGDVGISLECELSMAHRQASLPKDKVRKVVDYIASNLAEDGNLQDLADLVEMSLFHFCRSFKQSTGLTPHQYILHLRIEKAKGLLKNKRLGIADIASRLGFSDQSHFTNIFRRLAGTTPARWRASL